MNQKKANLFIVGAAKSGTTSLIEQLSHHPDVYVSPIKEPIFFGSDIKWEDFREEKKKNVYIDFKKYFDKRPLEKKHISFVDNIEDYSNLFSEVKNEKILAEASTAYLYSKNAAVEIKKYNPNSKIIIILRDPLDRLISHYLMDFSAGVQMEKNIVKGVENDFYTTRKGYFVSNLYVELSLYYEQIKRYFEVFDKSQVLILDYDELKLNPQKLFHKIFKFLDISIDISLNYESKFNETKNLKFKFLLKLKAIKKIIPKKIIDRIKKNKYIFDKNLNIQITDAQKQILRNYIESDWNKAKEFLNK